MEPPQMDAHEHDPIRALGGRKTSVPLNRDATGTPVTLPRSHQCWALRRDYGGPNGFVVGGDDAAASGLALMTTLGER